MLWGCGSHRDFISILDLNHAVVVGELQSGAYIRETCTVQKLNTLSLLYIQTQTNLRSLQVKRPVSSVHLGDSQKPSYETRETPFGTCWCNHNST